MDIAVVGGGISGLSAAWALCAAGLRVAAFERRPAAGGRIVSERAGGFLMEHGPNLVVGPAPGVEQLIAGTGIAAEKIGKGAGVRHRYIVRDGAARALPLEPLRFLASEFFSLRGRLRFLAEPFVAPHAGDESVADFVRRRFGREFLDYVVDPLVGGLYAGDPERLSAEAAFPQLKRLEREAGSVFAGLLRSRLARSGASALDPRRRELFSFRDGLATLPRALADALGDSLQTNAHVESLRPARAGFRLRVNGADLSARAVVLALPAYAAARLLSPLDTGAAEAAAAIAHPPLAVVFLGYAPGAIRRPLDGLGVLMPRAERRGVLGILFSSTLFAGRAPDGHVAVTAYVGGAREPGMAMQPPEALVHLVHQEMRQLFHARLRPAFSRVRYWRRSLPQPQVGHAALVARLRTAEAVCPGLYLAGNFLSGVSTAACVDEALAVARRARLHLAGTSAAGPDRALHRAHVRSPAEGAFHGRAVAQGQRVARARG